MTQVGDEEADLRRWLVGYLVTTVGVDPDRIDVDLPFNELGLGSRDGVVLAGELAELLGRPVSPIDIWQNPTVTALAYALTHPDSDPAPAVDGVGTAVVEPIAIIGLGCRMPGDINGPDELWEFLAARRSAVTAVPEDRWRPFYDGSPQTAQTLAATTRWGSFLSDVAGFDAEFFGITPREADYIDPQQRLILEVTVEALENAGIPADSLQRSKTGVFVGACVSEYGYLASRDVNQIQAWTGTGGSLSIIANRLSYFLDLHGPSLTIDTACSSSLVAVHLACQSLRAGQSELAIAGGVNMLLSPVVTRSFDQAEAMSPTGACHAFDAAADGFVRGEGCGVVVLKRLSDALRDSDQVLAVVRGSAVNSDGRSNGLMAPNPAAQAAVLRAACADAGVDPMSVDYVEAHGTGTLLGDPIEARALGAVYGRGRLPEAPLLVGAAKTNLGHLEAAAGIAGLIKATLAVQRGVIPPNQHFDTPNPHIPFDELGLKVADEPIEWPLSDHPRLAAVSSFGFGGTNAHVVLEQAPRTALRAPSPEAPVTTLVVSGKSRERMAASAAVIAEWMAGPGSGVPLTDVAHTLNHHRTHHPVFATVCAPDRDGAIAGLRALAAGEPAPGVVGTHAGVCGPGTVFVYSGQGSQWPGMGRQLLADEPAFAAAIADLDPEFIGQLGFSLREVIANGEAVEGSVRVQSVLFGIQVALTALWRSYGVEPDAVIGHSMGEVSAAVTAGVFSAGEGLEIIAARSQLMARLTDKGAVALLELDSASAQALIAEHPGVTITVYSSPRQTVVAGPTEAIDAVIDSARRRNVFAQRVNMEVASHHAMMDPILSDLRDSLAHLVPGFPVIPIISTVEDAGDAAQFDAEHWVANVRRPVRFAEAVAAAGAANCTFIEISPHPVLTKAISDTLADPGTGNDHHHSIGTLQRGVNDTVAFHTALNSTFTARPPVGPHPPEPHPKLPATPWRHSRHWLDFTPVHRGGQAGPPAGEQNSPVPTEWLYEPTWPVRPLPDEAPAAPGGWSVVGDDELAAQLGRGSLNNARQVLYAPSASGSAFDVAAAYRLFHEGRRLAMQLAEMPAPPKLFFLTRNAQPLTDGDRANPVQAVLWGLGRTLALEHPEVWGAVVDVDESMPAVLAARLVRSEAAAADGEDQIVYRSGVRHVPRLTPMAPGASDARLSADSSQLVIGATGHLGPHIIRQLAQMGAGTVVAVSRNPGEQLNGLAAQLHASGSRLVTVAADVTDAAAMGALFDRFGVDLPPLDGIYLAAFSGGPVTLSQMTDADVSAMFAPKLDALRILHELSLTSPVSHFVLFSSISGLLGSRWLAHYTATSAFLDTFAYARRTLGLPATVVNWGLWKSLADTPSADGAAAGEVMTDTGLEPMPDEVAIQALPMVMGRCAPVRSTVVAADWPLLAAAYRTRGALRILDDVLELQSKAEATAPESEFRKELRDCPPEDRRKLLADHIAATASAVMGLAASEPLDPTAGFFQLGMDSLMGVTLQRRLGVNLGIELPAALIFEYPTVESLTDALCQRLGIDDPTTAGGLAKSGLAARAQQRAKARQSAAASRRKGHVV